MDRSLGTEVYRNMLRKKSKAVPEGNGHIPMLGGVALEELQRIVSKTTRNTLEEVKEDLRRISVYQALIRTLGSHVSPWRRT